LTPEGAPELQHPQKSQRKNNRYLTPDFSCQAGAMQTSILRESRPRSAHFSRYKPAMDRIDAHLVRSNPEVEGERLKEIILLLFGERPQETDFGLGPEPRPTETHPAG
jgi:hypothetical protein